jgi:Flp pilus assembly protein TadG
MAVAREIVRTKRQLGSAALEVLLLIPFILLIFMLLLNMGYNSERKRKALAALRLGGATYVTKLTTTNAQQAESAAQSLINSQIFPGESNAANLYFSTSTNKPAGFEDEKNIMAKASSRVNLGVDVKRNPPYVDLVDRSDVTGTFTVSSNTWTFCELKDSDTAFGDLLNGLNLVGDYGLWLFGGCGGSAFDFKCDDKCP